MSTVFDNLALELPLVLAAMRYGAYAVGLATIAYSMHGFMQKSGPRGSDVSLWKPGGALVIGGALLAYDQWAWMLVASFTQPINDVTPTLSYMTTATTSTTPFTKMMRTVLGVVQFFGYVAVLRSLLFFQRATSGSHQHGVSDGVVTGLHHAFFGALAINIKYFLSGAASFFGFPVPSFVL